MQVHTEMAIPLVGKIIGPDMMHKTCSEHGLMTPMVGPGLLTSFVCNQVAKDLLSGQLEPFMMIQEEMRIQMCNGSITPAIIEVEQ